MHAFDIRTCAWSEVEAKGVTWNGWAGSVFAPAFDGVSLLVFGGHSASQVPQLLLFAATRIWRALTPRTQMTNESRIFNASTSSWASPPIVVSATPSPAAIATLTCVYVVATAGA